MYLTEPICRQMYRYTKDNFYKGHTFVDVMITMLIFSILLTALFSIFVPGLRSFIVGKDRAEVQCDIVVAIRRLKAELSTTTNSSVTINSSDTYGPTDTHAISFLSPYNDSGGSPKIQLDYATSTIPIWQKYIIYYYYPPDGELKRKVVAAPYLPMATANAVPLSHADLRDICNDAGITPAVISRNISITKIFRTNPYTIAFKLAASKDGAGFTGQQTQRMEVIIEVFPHNTLTL
jgi:hypothetical protein